MRGSLWSLRCLRGVKNWLEKDRDKAILWTRLRIGIILIGRGEMGVVDEGDDGKWKT